MTRLSNSLKSEAETDSTKINTIEYKASLEIYDSAKQLLKLVSLIKTELSIQPRCWQIKTKNQKIHQMVQWTSL